MKVYHLTTESDIFTKVSFFGKLYGIVKWLDKIIVWLQEEQYTNVMMNLPWH